MGLVALAGGVVLGAAATMILPPLLALPAGMFASGLIVLQIIKRRHAKRTEALTAITLPMRFAILPSIPVRKTSNTSLSRSRSSTAPAAIWPICLAPCRRSCATGSSCVARSGQSRPRGACRIMYYSALPVVIYLATSLSSPEGLSERV